MSWGSVNVASTAATNPGPAPPNHAAPSTANTNKPPSGSATPAGESCSSTASRMQAGASAYRSAAAANRSFRVNRLGSTSFLLRVGARDEKRRSIHPLCHGMGSARVYRDMSVLIKESSMTLSTRLLAGVAVPDSPLVSRAIEYARENSEPYLFNHVMRSWLFAVSLARQKGTAHDEEVLAVATILHDLGLAAAFDGPLRFEV